MAEKEQWLKWAIELQSLAQSALYFCKDPYDTERFKRIREISAEIMAAKSGLDLEKVQGLFCNETGYQTPKIDTRAAIVKDGRILLVQERTGKWSMPGGWCDVDQSPAENTVKEAREEAGKHIRNRSAEREENPANRNNNKTFLQAKVGIAFRFRNIIEAGAHNDSKDSADNQCERITVLMKE